VRLGLLGPVGDHIDALEAAAAFCAVTLEVDAIYYLGDDNPLVLLPKRVVDSYTEARFWVQDRLVQAEPAAIEAFVANERRERAIDAVSRFDASLVQRLTSTRGHFWVFCHSSKNLTREDQDQGHVLAYGNSPEWLIQRSGEQINVAPGPFESAGVMLLDDSDGLEVDVFSRKCELLHKRRLDFSPTMPPPPLASASEAADSL
jgi:hypothetical protein